MARIRQGHPSVREEDDTRGAHKNAALFLFSVRRTTTCKALEKTLTAQSFVFWALFCRRENRQRHRRL